MVGAKAGKDSKGKSKAVSRSARARLEFPVARIQIHLKKQTTSHGGVGATAAVYSAASCTSPLPVRRKTRSKFRIVCGLGSGGSQGRFDARLS